MRERQEVEKDVIRRKRQVGAVAIDRRAIHLIRQDDAFAVARRPARIEDVCHIVVIGFFHALPIFSTRLFGRSQLEKLVEIDAQVVRLFAFDGLVEDDNALQTLAEAQDAEGNVVLLLFAYKEESHLCIVHHISNLCAARRRIKRRGHCTYAVAAKADVHALRLILREDGDTLLPTYAQRQEGIRNAQNAR